MARYGEPNLYRQHQRATMVTNTNGFLTRSVLIFHFCGGCGGCLVKRDDTVAVTRLHLLF